MSETFGKRMKSTAKKPSTMSNKDPFFSKEKKAERYAMFEFRKMETHKFLDLNWFVHNGFKFPQLLIAQNLEKFCTLHGNLYPKLIREFYANLVKRGETWVTEVSGKRIIVDQDSLEEIVGLQNTGLTVAEGEDSDWDNYSFVSAYANCLRPGKNYDGRQMKAGLMKVNDRLLHYIIVYILLPRLYNKAQPCDEDMGYIFALKRGMQINWANVILCFMIRRFRDPAGVLPYPALVSKMIEEAGVDVTNEVKLCVRDRDDRIDQKALNKMKIIRRNGVWTWVEDALRGQQHEEAEAEEEIAANEQRFEQPMPPYMDDLINRLQGMMDQQSSQFRDFVVQQVERLEEKMDSDFTRMEAYLGSLGNSSFQSSHNQPPES